MGPVTLFKHCNYPLSINKGLYQLGLRRIICEYSLIMEVDFFNDSPARAF